MKTLQRIFATTLLALAFCASAHAGEMGTPPAPPPSPNITTTSPSNEEPGNQGFTASDAVTDGSIIAYDLICDLLSIF